MNDYIIVSLLVEIVLLQGLGGHSVEDLAAQD